MCIYYFPGTVLFLLCCTCLSLPTSLDPSLLKDLAFLPQILPLVQSRIPAPPGAG